MQILSLTRFNDVVSVSQRPLSRPLKRVMSMSGKRACSSRRTDARALAGILAHTPWTKSPRLGCDQLGRSKPWQRVASNAMIDAARTLIGA